MNEEHLKELTQTTERSKSNTHRIDKLEEQQALLHEMNKNIAVIALETKGNREGLKVVKEDIDEIKSKPNQLIDRLKENALGVIVGALVGALISLIL